MYIAKSMRFESLMFELLPIHSIQQNVPFYTIDIFAILWNISKGNQLPKCVQIWSAPF